MADFSDEQIEQMSDEEIQAALDAHKVPDAVSDAQIDNDIRDYKKYGDSALRTFAESAASSATLGLSDQAQVKLGISTPEEIKKRAEYNPVADVGGQITGTLAPMLASGGTSAAAKGIAKAGSAVLAAEKAGLLAEKATEKVLSQVLKQSTEKKLAREIVKKSIEKAAQGATEGAIYGAGQLVREDALGEADFNAENLLAYTGSGALIGGSLGSALPLAGAATSKLGQTVGKGANKIFTKYADPIADSAKLLGFTKAQAEKLNLKNPKFFEGVPDYIRDKLALKIGDSAEDLASKNRAIKKGAADELDAIYNQVGDRGVPKSTFNKVADTMEERFIKPYEGMESFKSAIIPARKIVKDIKSIAGRDGEITVKEMRAFRKKMDELSEAFYKARDPSKGAEAAFGARSLIRDEMNAFVKSIDPALGERLEQANKTFHYAETIGKALDKKALNNNNLLDFKDYALGGIFGGLLGNAGIAIPAAKKLLESDLKRRITILSGIEKSNKLVNQKIIDSAKGFVKNGRRAIIPLSVKALVSSPLANKDGKQPKNREEAFTNIRDKVKEFRADPEAFSNKVTKSIYAVSKAAPNAAQYMNEHAIRALDFIDEKLPKDLTEMMGPKFMQDEFMPSSLELAEFERYMQIVENPLSALDELEAGTLTREHVEALQKVYPSLYTRLRASVLDEVRNEPKMAYDKKIQLGILMDIETDQSMIPENVLALQANFNNTPPSNQGSMGAVNPTQSGVSKLNMADREATEVQSTIERE